MPLEALGRLEKFSDVFDLEVYRKYEHKNKVMILSAYGKEGFATDNVDFLREHNVKMPNKIEVILYKLKVFAKVNGRRVLGNKFYDGIKKILKK